MKKVFAVSALILSVAIILNSCSGGGGSSGFLPTTDGTGGTGGTGVVSATTTISGTVQLSSTVSAKPSSGTVYKAATDGSTMDKVLTAAGVKQATSQPPLQNAAMKLYNADRPDWIYPVSQIFTDSQGKYKFDTLMNSDLNGNVYTNGDPIPSGNYTVIATNDTTVSGGEQLVAVQTIVKRFAGDMTGNDLVVQDSDALPSVVFMLGLKPNNDGSFGSSGGTTAALAPNAGIQIIFSMAMARLSVMNAITVYLTSDASQTPVPGAWKFTPDLLTATFYPTGGMTASTEYAVKVAGGFTNTDAAVNVYGKPLPANVTAVFTTAAENDTTPPQNLMLLEPGSTDVKVTTPIMIGSPDEPIDINSMTVEGTPSIGDKPAINYVGIKQVMIPIPVNHLVDYYIYQIGHTPLKLGTNYSITISGVKDMAQNQISPLTFSFKTQNATAGVTTTPGALQDSQLAVKDVFGKWVNAMNSRNAAMLTTYMTGGFYWVPNGWDPFDLNRDGRLSLNEFRNRLFDMFETFDHCGTVISGDTPASPEIAITGSTADIQFKLTYTSTQNTADPLCPASSSTTMMKAQLEYINSAWLISKGADDAGSTYPTHLDVIELSAPGNGITFPEPTPSKPLAPDFVWNAVSGMTTYAIVITDPGSSKTGWLGIVDGSSAGQGDQLSIAFTGTAGCVKSDLAGICVQYVVPITLNGATTSVIAGKLVDSTAAFDAGYVVAAGDLVENTTTGATANVASVDAPGELTLDNDIFTNIGESYVIHYARDQRDLGFDNFITSLKAGGYYYWSVLGFKTAALSDFVAGLPAALDLGPDLGASSQPYNFSVANNAAPSVVSTTPANADIDVAVDGSITAVFSEAMDANTITQSTFLLALDEQYTNLVAPAASPDGITYDPRTRTAAFKPAAALGYEKQYYAKVTTGATDIASNGLAVEYTWIFQTVKAPDLTAPITTANPAGGTYRAVQNVQLTAADESGATIYYTIDGTTPTTGSSVYSGPVSMTEGTTVLKFFAVDASPAQNTEEAAYKTETYIVDLTAPKSSASPAGGTYNAAQDVTLSLDNPAGETGTTIHYTTDGSTPTADSTAYTGVINIASTKTLQFLAIDAAGNQEAIHAETYIIDEVAPETTIISAPPAISNNPYPTFSFTSTKAGSFECRMDGAAFTPCVNPAIYSTTAMTDGPHTFEVRAIDTVPSEGGGPNVDPSPARHDWTIDTAPPEGSITIDSGATYTTDVDVTLTLTLTSTDIELMQFSSDGLAWRDAEAKNTTKNWTLSAGDAAKYVYVRFKDTAGNWSAAFSDSIILDTAGPTGSISIKDGAAVTNSLSVTLNLSASDANGVAEMQFSDDGSAWLPVTPDAYATTKSWTLPSGADGTRAVYVKFKDKAGNWSSVYSDTITVDTTPPDTTIISGPPSLTNSLYPSFGFTSETGASFECNMDNAGWTPCISPASYTTTAMTTGPHTFQVRATDINGNVDQSPASHAWTIDTAAPGGTITIVGVPDPTDPTNTEKTVSISVTLTLSSADATEMQLSNDGVSWRAAEPYAATKPWFLAVGGSMTKAVYVKFKDTAGNWSAAVSDTIGLIAGPPETAASPGGGTYNTGLEITLTAIAQFPPVDTYYTTDGTDPDCAGSMSGTTQLYANPIVISGAAPNSVTLKYCSKDTIKTETPFKTQVYNIDTVAPGGSFSITGNAGAQAGYTNTVSVTLTNSISDPVNAGSGMATMQFSNDGTSWSQLETYAATRAWTISSGDGAKAVYGRYYDVAGNSFTTGAAITLDTIAPSSSATPTGGLYNSTQNVVLQASSDGTGTVRYTTNGTDPDGSSTTYTIPIPISTTTTLKYYATDLAGNAEPIRSQLYTIDSAAPTGSIAINGGASYTTSRSVTLSLSATDPSGVVQMKFSEDNFNTETLPEPYATAKAWTIQSVNDGTKSISVKFMDNAGNWSSPALADSIVLDTAAPTGGSIQVRNVSNYTYTNTTTVTLDLYASDTGSGVGYMQISNDNVNWTTYVYGTSVSWPIAAGDGTKYVYAKFRDNAGNWTASIYDTIVLDTAAPNTSITGYPANPTTFTTIGETVTVSFSFSSTEAGSTFMCSLDGAAYTDCLSPMSYDFTNGVLYHTFYVYTVDPAGNGDPSAAGYGWTIDTTGKWDTTGYRWDQSTWGN